MERPGFLEFVVYALVLAVVGGWVYGVPPFDYEPVNWVRSAPVQSASATRPTSAASSLEPESSPAVTDANLDNSAEDVGEAECASVPELEEEPEGEPRPDPRTNLLVVTARSLNMRSRPDAGSALVGNYPRGALVEPMETSGNWVRVRTDDDLTGWMYSAYLGIPDENRDGN
jgi:uncharacterized protein YgiM (DUF1202 family)